MLVAPVCRAADPDSIKPITSSRLSQSTSLAPIITEIQDIIHLKSTLFMYSLIL